MIEQTRNTTRIRIAVEDMNALGIRSKGRNAPNLSEFVYQVLPTRAMALLATLPDCNFPVSISDGAGLLRNELQRSRTPHGYLIQNNPPQVSDGFVITYTLQPDRCYEAIDISYQSGKHSVEEFRKLSQQWVKEHLGSLQAIPGRYAYFAPTRKLWSVIIGDCGYTAIDPSAGAPDLTGDLLKDFPETAGVVFRIPVYRGGKQPPGESISCFSRVKLALDPHPGSGSRWIGFEEYEKARALQSRPPAFILPCYREWLEQFTRESGFQSWVFRNGTLFGDAAEWWGDQNQRRANHEGIDFVEGLTSAKETKNIPEGTIVRAIADGEVVAFLDDFLNKTIVVRHRATMQEGNLVFYIFYSHVQPENEIKGPIEKGHVLGRVIRARSVKAPAHLHLTFAWIPQSLPPDKLSMDIVSPSYAPVLLIDPTEGKKSD
jgi:hypothetical protein